MLMSEIFESVQGEGKYAGYPVLFIRLSGCNRECEFCDSRYHKKGKKRTVESMIKIINKSKKDIVVWTGGEPTLQIKEIKKVIKETSDKNHHLETNGYRPSAAEYYVFDYICFSPKDYSSMRNLNNNTNFFLLDSTTFDIKIVTDLKINKNLIKYATMLMPLSVDYNGPKDNEIEKKVFQYCSDNNLKFCLRQHIKVWGNQRGK